MSENQHSDPMRMLDERFARGEISADEYLSRKAILSQERQPPIHKSNRKTDTKQASIGHLVFVGILFYIFNCFWLLNVLVLVFEIIGWTTLISTYNIDWGAAWAGYIAFTLAIFIRKPPLGPARNIYYAITITLTGFLIVESIMSGLGII